MDHAAGRTSRRWVPEPGQTTQTRTRPSRLAPRRGAFVDGPGRRSRPARQAQEPVIRAEPAAPSTTPDPPRPADDPVTTRPAAVKCHRPAPSRGSDTCVEAKALVPPRRRGERQQVDIRRAEPARRVPLQQPSDDRRSGPAVSVLLEDKNAGKLPELPLVGRRRVAFPSSFIGAARERLATAVQGKDANPVGGSGSASHAASTSSAPRDPGAASKSSGSAAAGPSGRSCPQPMRWPSDSATSKQSTLIDNGFIRFFAIVVAMGTRSPNEPRRKRRHCAGCSRSSVAASVFII